MAVKKKVKSKFPKKGRWSTSKKVEYDGVLFQSGLELYMYKALKKAEIPFSYEGTSYTLVEKGDYKGECFERFTKKSKQLKNRKTIRLSIYTPDFIGEGESWIIETKGFAIQPFPLKWKMFKHKMNKRKKPPILFMPKNEADCDQTVQLLLERGFSNEQKGAKLLYINVKKKETNGRRK